MSFYLIIDVEASGQEVTQHQLLALGACVVSVETGRVAEPRAEHMLRVIFDYTDPGTPTPCTQWEAKTLTEFWQNPAKGTGNGRTPLELLHDLAMQQGPTQSAPAGTAAFVAWARGMAARYPKNLVVMSDTACFDAAWLQYYLSAHAERECFGAGLPNSLNYLTGRYQAVRDTTSFAMGVARRLPTDGMNGSGKAALISLGVTDGLFPADVRAVPHDHDPLHDAERIGLEAVHVAGLVEMANCLAGMNTALQRTEVEPVAAHKMNAHRFVHPNPTLEADVTAAAFQRFCDQMMATVPDAGAPADGYLYNTHMGAWLRSLKEAKNHFVDMKAAFVTARVMPPAMAPPVKRTYPL